MSFNNQGKIIAFEGLDGSGKETQSKLLEQKLEKKGIKVKRIEFPNYHNQYSLFVKEYLEGNFGKDVDPYVASTFFSLDRLGVYKKIMKKYLEEGYVVLCDRYVYSNLIYQGSKIKDFKNREDYFKWVLDFEYNKCGLPKEEISFFMDVPVDISLDILKLREEKDIHEENEEFLRLCYENSQYIVNKYDLVNVECSYRGKLRSIEEINEYLYNYIIEVLF